jgi:hypothetical protein
MNLKAISVQVIIYDQAIIKICSQPGSNQMDCEKSEPSTKQEEKTNGTCNEIERQVENRNIQRVASFVIQGRSLSRMPSQCMALRKF